MVPTETKEIDGTTFCVKGLDLRAERAALVRLAKVIGPALVELGAGGKAPAAIGALFAGLDDADIEHFVGVFKPVTEVKMVMANGENWVPYMETAFKKGASSQLKWLWFCLEHQFASFLGFESGKVDELKAKLVELLQASPFASPQT